MPDLVHGRLNNVDRVTMSAHVESCASCRAELQLLQQLRDCAPLAPRMDAVRIASAIRPYGGAALTTPVGRHQEARNSWTRPLLAIAAVAAVVTGSLSVVRSSETSTAKDAPSGAAASAPALSRSVATAEGVVTGTGAKPVIEHGARPAETSSGTEVRLASLSLVGGTQDLSEAQLESLLAELEGIDSLPSAEPQSVTHSVENFEGGS